MINRSIKRVLSIALLVAFTTPSTFALSEMSSTVANRASMNLAGGMQLIDTDSTITLSLRDSDVKQVLRMFADKAKMNIVFHNSVSGKVTLDLVDTQLNEAFDLVLQVAGLNYYKQGNTMIVMAKNSPDNAIYSKQEMMTFPIKYVNATKIADFLNKNVFGMKKAGLSSVDAATVNSATNELIVFGMPGDVAIVEKVIAQFDREPFSKTFAVNHTTPAEMANMICNVLLPSRGVGGASSSFSSSPSSSGEETGFASDIGGGEGSSIKLGEGVLACSVSASSSSAGIAPFDVQNLSIAYFPQRGTITLMGGSEAQAKMIETFIKEHDVKQPQAMLEISIVELNEQGSKEFQNQWSFSTKTWGFDFNGTSTGISRQSGPGQNYIRSTEYVWNAGPQVESEGKFPGAPIDNGDGTWTVPQQIKRDIYSIMPATSYVSWQMNYLIENRKARVLANPKIMITNGQESIIDLTQDYVEKVTSEYLSSASNGQSSVGTAQRNYTIGSDLGIKVTLTPFISPEGYVTVNIKPEYSTQAGEVRSTSEVTGQSDLAATLLSRRNLDLKNVRIKDGETLVIGGLIQESEQKTVHKVPFLGDLPVIGTLFRSSATSKAKSELVIMITPKIINDDENVAVDI